MTNLLTRLKEATGPDRVLQLHKQSECSVCAGTSLVCQNCGYGGSLKCKEPDSVCGKSILCIACAPAPASNSYGGA